jgi:hypothetical protein
LNTNLYCHLFIFLWCARGINIPVIISKYASPHSDNKTVAVCRKSELWIRIGAKRPFQQWKVVVVFCEFVANSLNLKMNAEKSRWQWVLMWRLLLLRGNLTRDFRPLVFFHHTTSPWITG